MDFAYETDRLVLKVEHHTIAPKVLHFYKKNRPYFDAFELTRPDNFYTTAFQSASLSYEYNEILKKRALRFWIYEKESYYTNSSMAPVIGSVSISNILHGSFHTGMFGYKIDHDHWHKGYAFEACSFLIPLLFSDFGLHRLEAYIMPANEKSIALIKRLGFEYEGIKHDCAKINHRWEDHLQYAKIDSLSK